MTISICTTVFNDKRTLKLMMDSVLKQDYQNIEHIITDGGSTDGSIELIREYENKYADCGKKLIWKSEKDNGISDGINKAVTLSSGKYIILGTDPYCNSHSISTIVSEIEKGDYDYVYGGMIFQKNGEIIRQWSGKPGNWRLGWIAATPTLCMKKEVWHKHGPFDLKYKGAADYKFQIQIFCDKTLSSSSIRKPLVLYSAGGTSNGGIKANVDSIKENFRIMRECGVKFGWITVICKIIIAFCAYTFASHKKINLEDDYK